MVGIDRITPHRMPTIRIGGAARPGVGFTLPLDDARAASSIGAPIAASGMGEQPRDQAEEDTHARQTASSMLSELGSLQATLLADGDPGPILRRLDAMLSVTHDGASPPVLALLSAVRVRARVELARRGWG